MNVDGIYPEDRRDRDPDKRHDCYSRQGCYSSQDKKDKSGKKVKKERTLSTQLRNFTENLIKYFH